MKGYPKLKYQSSANQADVESGIHCEIDLVKPSQYLMGCQ